MDELKVLVSPGYRCRRGQVSIMGDSTEIVNNFEHLSKYFVLSPECREGHSNLPSISQIQ